MLRNHCAFASFRALRFRDRNPPFAFVVVPFVDEGDVPFAVEGGVPFAVEGDVPSPLFGCLIVREGEGEGDGERRARRRVR